MTPAMLPGRIEFNLKPSAGTG